jgi:hypothetical protein
MPEKTTVGNILLQNDGEWINEGFDCYISGGQIVNGQKGPFFKCQLTDTQNSSARIAGTFFGQKAALPDGYYFVTDGAKRTEYNGVAQVTAFQKVKIQQAESPTGVPAAAAPIGQPVAVWTPVAQPAAPAAVQGIPIHGAQVGMAINNATNILKEVHKNDAGYYNSKDFAKDLFGIASTIVRTSQAIEGGRLAPAPGERIMESAPVPAAPVAAPPEPAAPAARRPVQLDIDEDVPF